MEGVLYIASLSPSPDRWAKQAMTNRGSWDLREIDNSINYRDIPCSIHCTRNEWSARSLSRQEAILIVTVRESSDFKTQSPRKINGLLPVHLRRRHAILRRQEKHVLPVCLCSDAIHGTTTMESYADDMQSTAQRLCKKQGSNNMFSL
jgi:hypothetical protein